MNAIFMDTLLSKIMLIAIVSLFLVIWFGAIFLCYTKWFLAQGATSSSSSPSPPILAPPTMVFGLPMISLENLFAINSRISTNNNLYVRYRRSPLNTNKGLDSSAISSIPQFVFKSEEHSQSNNNGNNGLLLLECVICLSLFEDGDKCRKLGLCEHAFHLECVDMWLRSHKTCPVCRARADVRAVRTNHGTNSNSNSNNNNVMNSEEFCEMRVVRGEEPSRLDIVVEVPNMQNNIGSMDACSSQSN
ncbi:hypothetical protein ABFS83_14G069100 [Erythranthe nasuta]